MFYIGNLLSAPAMCSSLIWDSVWSCCTKCPHLGWLALWMISMNAVSPSPVQRMQLTATRETQKDEPVLEHNVIPFGFSDCYYYLASPKRLNSASLQFQFSKKAPASGGSCCWSFSDWLKKLYYKIHNSQFFFTHFGRNQVSGKNPS